MYRVIRRFGLSRVPSIYGVIEPYLSVFGSLKVLYDLQALRLPNLSLAPYLGAASELIDGALSNAFVRNTRTFTQGWLSESGGGRSIKRIYLESGVVSAENPYVEGASAGETRKP